MASQLAITAMQPQDWPRVRAIYQEGLSTGLAAFMAKAPVWTKWDKGHLAVGRLVARSGDVTLGWSALAPVADS